MRVEIKYPIALLLTVAAVTFASTVAHAQKTDPPQYLSRPELALDYTYMRSNAPPGGCGCFNLNGGSATFAWPIKSGQFALVGDITAAHAGSISSNGLDLTLSTYTFGGRYRPTLGHLPLQPFGQVLIGVAHSSGSLVDGANSGSSNAGAAFASVLGGGLDLGAKPRFSFRLVEADYVITTFDNGTNDHQNNLRLSTGVVFHF